MSLTKDFDNGTWFTTLQGDGVVTTSEAVENDLIQLGDPQAHYNTSHTRILKYSIEMYHRALKNIN